MTVPKPSALQDSSASGADFREFGNVEFTFDEFWEPSEADLEELAEAKQTIDPPKPSENSGRAARWIKTPPSMLADLTTALNRILGSCRMRFADSPYLVYENDGLKKALDITELIPLCRCVDIRNDIEKTPFGSEVLQKLFHFLTTPEHEIHELPYRTLSDLIFDCQTHLRNLADWIEAKSILAGNPAPPRARGNRTLSEVEIEKVYIELRGRRGIPQTKEGFGMVMNELFPDKTLGNAARIKWLKQLHKKYGFKSKSSPPNKPD
jgi:hypothetical protein